MSLIFVDVEAQFNSPCPGVGDGMTEFGAVEFETRKWFHGDRQHNYGIDTQDKGLMSWYPVMLGFQEWIYKFKGPYIFVSDNPAYDWQWINYHFHSELGHNPFGHSARRIGDFYAGLTGDFRNASKWKKLRITKHTHMPVDDAMVNAEAFERMSKGERG